MASIISTLDSDKTIKYLHFDKIYLFWDLGINSHIARYEA
jgi:hypothetical protein